MFDKERWLEIISILAKNKLRPMLTGFSIAWGIFILIILLGSGTGLENGIKENFKGEALNSIWIYGGTTMKDFNGQAAGRNIQMTNEDVEIVSKRIEGINNISPLLYIENEVPVRYGKNSGKFSVEAVYPENRKIVRVELKEGRFINHADIRKTRKNVLIDVKARKSLFGESSPIGKAICINGIPFTVVGVFKSLLSFENRKIYIPFTSGQKLFLKNNNVDSIAFLVDDSLSLKESRVIEAETKIVLSKKHRFAVDDPGALMTLNSFAESIMIKKLFRGIRLFLWITGIGTIVAGIVGISNIMLITVKERTKEIGIRKAVGATPFSIILMVVSEAALITVIAGYIGLVLGVGTLEIVNFFIESSASNVQETTDAMGNFTIFKNPSVDFIIAVQATILLVVSGVFAGFFPARRAALVKPVEAMKE